MGLLFSVILVLFRHVLKNGIGFLKKDTSKLGYFKKCFCFSFSYVSLEINEVLTGLDLDN